MKILLKVAALLALAATAAGAEDCGICYCSTSKRMFCTNLDLTGPPAGDWPQIDTLSLENNNITKLHVDSFIGFPNLDSLYLESNPLTELDFAVFASITTLTNLQVWSNQITSLTSSQEGIVLEKLETLSLGNNKIVTLDPDQIAKVAPNLQSLSLYGNPFVLEEGKALINHPTLTYLTVDNVAKLNLGPQSFAQLPKVTRLSLKNSSITDISGAFATNSRLYTLTLRENDIQEVRAGALPSSSSIFQLILDENPVLSRIDPAALADAMKAKGYVQFSDSALACSCDYVGLYWWAKGKGVYVNSACQGNYKFCSFD